MNAGFNKISLFVLIIFMKKILYLLYVGQVAVRG